MAKNYGSEGRNGRNCSETSGKNTYGNEMDRTDDLRSKKETDCKDRAKDKTKNKTSQSYTSEENRY